MRFLAVFFLFSVSNPLDLQAEPVVQTNEIVAIRQYHKFVETGIVPKTWYKKKLSSLEAIDYTLKVLGLPETIQMKPDGLEGTDLPTTVLIERVLKAYPQQSDSRLLCEILDLVRSIDSEDELYLFDSDGPAGLVGCVLVRDGKQNRFTIIYQN